MKPTFLYIKTHNITGLKYFGKTVKDPYVYKGSGTVWLRHLRKHGDEVSTFVLNNGQPFTSEDAIRAAATAFSLSESIVQSRNWANLMIEDGFTGGSFINGYTENEYIELCQRNREIANRPEVVEKKRKISKEVQNRQDVKLKKSINGKIAQNDPAHKARQSLQMIEASKIRFECPHCHKMANRQMFARWHGDKCKLKV